MNEHINSSPVQRLQYTLLPVPRIPISPHLHITCSAALGIFQKVIFSQAFYNHSFSNWSCPQTLLDCLCACVHAKSLQSYPTLCNLAVCSWPGTSVHGILQARTLQWVAMPSCGGSSRPRDQTHVSYVSCIGRRVLYYKPMGADRHKMDTDLGPFLQN